MVACFPSPWPAQASGRGCPGSPGTQAGLTGPPGRAQAPHGSPSTFPSPRVACPDHSPAARFRPLSRAGSDSGSCAPQTGPGGAGVGSGTSWLRVQLASAEPGRGRGSSTDSQTRGRSPRLGACSDRTAVGQGAARATCHSATVGCGAGPRAVEGAGGECTGRHGVGRPAHPGPLKSWNGGGLRQGSERGPATRGGPGPRPDPAACPAAWRVVRPSAQTRLTGPLGCSDGVLIIVIADGNTGVWRRWGLVQNRPGPWGPCIRAQSRPPHCPRLCSRPCLPGPGPTTPPGTRAGSPVGTVPRH